MFQHSFKIVVIPNKARILESHQDGCADPEKFIRGGGGVQIPKRGLTENFNMAKINNLAIPGGSGRPVPPPLDPPMRCQDFHIFTQVLDFVIIVLFIHSTKTFRNVQKKGHLETSRHTANFFHETNVITCKNV